MKTKGVRRGLVPKIRHRQKRKRDFYKRIDDSEPPRRGLELEQRAPGVGLAEQKLFSSARTQFYQVIVLWSRPTVRRGSEVKRVIQARPTTPYNAQRWYLGGRCEKPELERRIERAVVSENGVWR